MAQTDPPRTPRDSDPGNVVIPPAVESKISQEMAEPEAVPEVVPKHGTFVFPNGARYGRVQAVLFFPSDSSMNEVVQPQ